MSFFIGKLTGNITKAILWRRIAFLCLLLLNFQLFAVEGAALASVQPGKVVQVADDKGYPPYIYFNAAGQPEGFEADLFTLLGKNTGIKFEWTLTEFDIAVDMLRSGKTDLIPGMNITEERQNVFAFTRPYLQDQGMLFVPMDSFHISRFDDLAGRRVGVQQGEVAEQYVRQKNAQINVYRFSNQRELLQAVADRKVDAAICNYFSGLYFLYQLQLDGKVKTIGEALYSHPFAIAADKKNQGNLELLAILDQELEKIQANGQMEALRDKWFGRQNQIFGMNRKTLVNYLELAAGGVLVIGGLALFFIIVLRRKIAQATQEIIGQRDELHKAYQELAAQNEELMAQDEMLGYQNRVLQQHENQLTERTRMIEALQDTTLEVLQIDDNELLFQRILKRAAQIAGTPHGIIDAWDAEKREQNTWATMGLSAKTKYIPNKGLAHEVICSKKTIVLEDYSTWDSGVMCRN